MTPAQLQEARFQDTQIEAYDKAVRELLTYLEPRGYSLIYDDYTINVAYKGIPLEADLVADQLYEFLSPIEAAERARQDYEDMQYLRTIETQS